MKKQYIIKISLVKNKIALAFLMMFVSIQMFGAYCTNTNGGSTSYYVNNFSTTAGSTNITNNGSNFSANGYGDFTVKVVTAIIGGTVNWSIASGNGTMGYAIWVDWNQDQDFADAGEQVYMSSSGALSATGSITVPGGALAGNTRMRVVGDWMNGSVPGGACLGSSYTECEDYTFSVGAAGPMVYSSCTTTQTNISNVFKNTTNNQVIGIEIVTTGSTSPLNVSSFTLNTAGTTNVADITNATLWTTGSSSTFATTTQIGGTVAAPSGAFTINSGANMPYTLGTGTNYFWLTYDVPAGATTNNVIDASCTSLTVSSAQTPTITAPGGSRQIKVIILDGTFSLGTTFALNGMTSVNGSTNKWIIGTDTHNGAPNSAYINNTGTNNDYKLTTVDVSHFYYDYNFPAGQTIINLTFDWKCAGESSYDDLKVFLVPTSTTPVAGTSLASGQIGVTYNSQTTWQSVNITLAAANAGTTQRLVFSWRNDGSGGTQPPAAVDNILITTSAPAPMTYVSSAVTQSNTTPVAIGSNSNEVIGIQVVTAGIASPISVTQFTVNANGSTAIADINAANSAKIYYTGNSSTFATTTLFGQNTPTIANFTIGGTQALVNGTNYFWLVYDVQGTATAGDVIDGQCTSIACSGAQTPSPTTVVGSRPIVNQVTIGTGTSTGTYPFYTYFGYSRSASLFTSAEVGLPTVLTHLAWNISTANATDNIPVKIYLKTTTSTALTAGTWANMISGATLVYDATTTFTPTGWKTFDITDFTYCNDNLLVLCEANYGSSGAGSDYPYFYYTTATNSHETWSQDATAPTGNGSVGSSRPNIRIDKSTAVLCTGVPTAGTANASPNSICLPLSSLLSVTGSSITCGLTYQWQSAALLAGPYTDIPGATSTTYTAYPTSNTYYRRAITCGASTVYTAGVLVTVTGPVYAAIGYTTSFEAKWLSRCGTEEIPDNFWVASIPVINNKSWRRDNDGATATWTTPANGMYVPAGSLGNRSARYHSYYASGKGYLDLYIDLSTQAGTKMLSFDYINTSGTDQMKVYLSTDGGITFPITLNTVTLAAAWTTYYASLSSNSATCVIRFEANGDAGATSDMGLDAVSITPPCSSAPAPGTATTSIASFCNTGTPTLSVTGYTVSGGITFQWESSVSNSPYSWSVITSGQSTTYTASPAINQTTYYRCAVSCGASTSYTNIVTVTNSAQQITGTNSPVTVTCNTAANMTATATGGTISWYANLAGGSSLATGGSYSPVVSANTTYYCAAGAGGSTSNVGKVSSPLSDGYYGSSNTGLVFNAITAFTLVSVKVYVQTASSNVIIQFQDNTGTAIGANYTFNNCPAGLNTLTLNISVPVGTGYRLVSNNTNSLGRDFTAAFPYTQAGICSITGAVLGGSSSTAYYFFYDWVISSGCESTPRTPVNVIVSGGVTAPVCSGTPSPADNATGICPVSTLISWSASVTSCRAATGYKLYFGTDAAATNIYNGLDIGLVTTYNLGNLSGLTAYYWRIVPYNSAGNGTCATVWKFTTVGNPGNICATNMGTGVINVAVLPYASGPGTTENQVNDITAANSVTCGSSSYLGGEDQVFIFTPALSGSITATVTSTGSWTGLMLYDGCPLTGIICGAVQGNCIGYSQDSYGTRSLTVCVTAGITYYLVLDSYPSPDFNSYSNLTISAPTGSVASNDLPCTAIPLNLGGITNGNNSCTGGSSEPATPSCWTYGLLNTVWYTVVCPASGKLNISTTLGTLTNTQIAVYSGSCASLSFVTGACNDNISGCGSSNASMLQLTGLTPGATYYIRVDGGYDLIGSFDITAYDGNTPPPTTLGQDCSAPLPTCATMLNTADPGYSGTGSVCDFDGTYDCTGGDRAAVFYTIDIASAGQLMFNIVPNDYSGGYPGDGTDYDFIIWKTAGSGTLATCSSISTNSSIGMIACNYSYIDVTGLYTGGNAPAIYGSGFDDAYEPPVTVAAGDQYLLWISNFSLSTSGFTINYANSTPSAAIINIAAVPTLVAWTGATSGAWALADNWGGCGSPNSCATSVVIPSYQPTMPIISTNISVNDLTINSGATLTVNTTRTLTICGNFINNGTLIVNGTGRVIFAGTGAQICNNNGVALTIPNVTINNTGAGVTLGGSNGNMIITSSFTLTSGKLYTSNSAMLVINAGATSTPGTTTSFVDGPMEKLGIDPFVFPLGDGTRWARLAMSAPTASTTFKAEYFATPYSSLTPMDLTQGAAILNHVSSLEYWQFDRPVGTGNTSVTLYWENSTFSIMYLCASYLDLSVAKWTGTAWTNLNPTGGVITGTCGVGGSGTITTQTAVTSFSPFTFGSLKSPVQNPLPIEILSFTGKKQDDVNVIDWKTASEFNNDYFMLMKSKDGVNFEDLYKVNGALNSNSILSYSYIDNAPFDPISFYKLKQVDINGYYTYSNVISINNNNNSDQPELVELYPNPSATVINLVIYSPEEGEVDLELIDMYGKTVSIERLKVKKGRDILTVDISKFANGVYASKITFIDYNYSDYKRFIKK